MGRRGRQSVWEHVTHKELVCAIEGSTCFSDVVRAIFDVDNPAGHIRKVKQRILTEGIDVSHFTRRGVGYRGMQSIPLDKVLVRGSAYSRNHLKRRLIAKGMLKNECVLCGQFPKWKGKPLVMVLDHINGIKNDNRINNLRLLCPNCNSQTDTFSGRNLKRARVYHCADCKKEVGRCAVRCRDCEDTRRKSQQRGTKIKWPSIKRLLSMVDATSYSAVARELGVSNTAVRKRVIKHFDGA